MTTYQCIQTTIEELIDWKADLETGPFSNDTAEWTERLNLVSAALVALLALRHKAFDVPAMEQDVRAYEEQAAAEEAAMEHRVIGYTKGLSGWIKTPVSTHPTRIEAETEAKRLEQLPDRPFAHYGVRGPGDI